jgi:hypothetical protein
VRPRPFVQHLPEPRHLHQHVFLPKTPKVYIRSDKSIEIISTLSNRFDRDVKFPPSQLTNMSESPQTTQSVKRPLEDASSPSRNDQPEAKRPALDKFVKEEEEPKTATADSNGDAAPTSAVSSDAANGASKANGEKLNVKDVQGDTVVPDAPENKATVTVTTTNVSHNQSAPHSASTHDETAWLHVRALISSPEAATVIGKGGENVSKIRSMSGAKCTVSDYQKGAVERILTVIGVVDAVAKVRRGTLYLTTNWLTHLGFRSDHPHLEQ